MKLTAFFLFILCLQVAARTSGQTVTLDLKKAPIEKVFTEVSKQTGYSFLYSESLFKNVSPVTIKVKDASLTDVLNRCLAGQPVSFTVQGTAIVIKKAEVPITVPSDNIVEPLPPSDITGRITNEQGQALSGASVIIKRTGHGDISNANGNFTLKNVNSDDILVISYVGYNQQKIKVGSITHFTIVMEVTSDELDKVQVQAYGTTTRRLTTGNIATVTSAEIERQPVMNALTALQGKVPGLVITQNNGYASAPFKVELRGRSVIDPSHVSDPLYIIDGVPLTVLELQGNYAGSTGFSQNGLPGPAGGESPLFSLNSNDIESITVLKDADATAIYGSRGANGVIIIDTKKGKAGKTKFDLHAYHGISKVTQHYATLNTTQYLAMRHEAFANDGIIPDVGNAYDLLSWDTTRYTDWQKYLWGGMGKTTDLQGSLSGGDKQTTFRVGTAYHRETDILTVSGANQRASAQFNLLHKSVDQKLNFSFTSTYSYSKSDIIGIPGNVLYSPNAPSELDVQGNLNWTGWQPIPNPFGSLLSPYSEKTNFLNSRFYLQYTLMKGLNVSTSVGYSSMHNSQIFLQPIVSLDPQTSPKGTADFGNNNLSNAIVEPQIEYKKVISKGTFSSLIGSSLQTVSQDGNHIIGSGYTNDNLLRSVSNAPSRYATDNNSQYKYAAIFMRLNFNWADKYVLNLSARRDGSTKFGPGRQYGNFGAIGAAYVFAEENWFKNHVSFLSFGKIRGSYGMTGSDNIGDYNFLSQWTNVNANYQPGLPSYIPIIHANPNLEWQVNRKLEGALDLGFWKDRLNIEFALYENRCGNQLVRTPLPIITGFNTVTANLPATIQNTGLESSITAKIINLKSFGWSANFEIGLNRNKLIAFPNLEQSTYAGSFIIGQSLNIVRLLHFTGVDPQTGLNTFLDKNHDGQINFQSRDTANDLFNKDLSVKFDGGFGTDIHFKGWELNLFFHFRKQQLLSNSATFGTPGTIGNFSTEVLNRWQKPGDVVAFAKFTTQPDQTYTYYFLSDGQYCDGSYVRLQNLSLSCDLSEKLIKNMRIQECKVYIRGENLFLITKYKGIDPDVPVFGGMPPSKILVGGIQFNF